MQIILNLLQGDWFKPVTICCFIFLIWQVSNHIPTEIKGLKQDIKEVNQKINYKIDNHHQELKQEIKEVRQDINKRFDDIYKVLIDIKNK